MRLLTFKEAVKVCQELDCQDCPCSDYGKFDRLGEMALSRLACCEKLTEDYTYEDFKEILEK